ncbi:hypothetical protein [Virgibacillus sp. 6R]|uniref:hypothetical protein n=1 Tax=Metabacillus sp. 22489 TaxID=3453928 RepID=UPI0011A9D48B
MFDFYFVFIVAAFLAVQYFFSTRNSVYWGAILPVVYLITMIWMLVTERLENMLAFLLYLILGMLFLLAEWKKGRDWVNEKRKRELEKMVTHDMK